MKTKTLHQVAGLLAAAVVATGAAHAQLLQPRPQPGTETPRADVTRKAPVVTDTRRGPGTQTEDDIYIGRKIKGGAVTQPATNTATTSASTQAMLPRSTKNLPTVGTAGGTKPLVGTRARGTGDEDEMDDLDIKRRKAQGLPDNKPSSPKSGGGAGGESPQAERR